MPTYPVLPLTKAAAQKEKAVAHDYSDFREETVVPEDILTQLADAARKQVKAELKLAQAAAVVDKADSELKLITEKLIPDLMEKAGMKIFVTVEGLKVELVEQINCAISEDNKPEAFKWMEDNDHSDIIKREVIIEFGKGEEAWAKKFLADLEKRKKKLHSKVKKAVHPATLKAFVKGLLEDGTEFPHDKFGLYRRNVSKVQVPDGQKPRGKK